MLDCARTVAARSLEHQQSRGYLISTTRVGQPSGLYAANGSYLLAAVVENYNELLVVDVFCADPTNKCTHHLNFHCSLEKLDAKQGADRWVDWCCMPCRLMQAGDIDAIARGMLMQVRGSNTTVQGRKMQGIYQAIVYTRFLLYCVKYIHVRA